MPTLPGKPVEQESEVVLSNSVALDLEGSANQPCSMSVLDCLSATELQSSSQKDQIADESRSSATNLVLRPSLWRL